MTPPRFDISGEIVEGTAARVAAFLADNTGLVEVVVNSPGGLAMEGVAVLAALQRRSRDVTVRIEGCALSAASLLAMGARQIVMHEAAVMMIHEPQAFMFGAADDLRVQAETLDKIGGIYAAA